MPVSRRRVLKATSVAAVKDRFKKCLLGRLREKIEINFYDCLYSRMTRTPVRPVDNTTQGVNTLRSRTLLSHKDAYDVYVIVKCPVNVITLGIRAWRILRCSDGGGCVRNNHRRFMSESSPQGCEGRNWRRDRETNRSHPRLRST